jgi:hypothetical protein
VEPRRDCDASNDHHDSGDCYDSAEEHGGLGRLGGYDGHDSPGDELEAHGGVYARDDGKRDRWRASPSDCKGGCGGRLPSDGCRWKRRQPP